MDKPHLHSLDQKLLDIAKGEETKGLVQLTPEKMEDLADIVQQRINDEPDYYQKICDALTQEQRLAVTAWVMRHLCAHATEGGTYRYLIYGRLGFGPEAYLPLQLAGGLDISNEFDLSQKETYYVCDIKKPLEEVPCQILIKKSDAVDYIQSLDGFEKLPDWEAEREFRKRYGDGFVEIYLPIIKK